MPTIAPPPEARAVTIAAALSRRYGPLALGRATQHESAAVAAGNLARADLFFAVRAIITDRDGVFSRWRAAG